jgi:hypothetical protein
MAVVLLGGAGCVGRDPFEESTEYTLRPRCDESVEVCCPPGSHQEYDTRGNPTEIVCAADGPPCVEATADAGACEDGGSDAH